MMCPECGSKNYHESRQCPLHNRQPVCTSCCKDCKYYKAENFRCGYYIAHPVKARELTELDILDRKIKRKEEQMEIMYKSKTPWVGRKIEIEINRLKAERKALLKK